jgi:YD repeat-containing protein
MTKRVPGTRLAAIVMLWGALTLTANRTEAAKVVYIYDQAGRLIEVDYANGTVVKYTLDAAGSRANVQTTLNAIPSRPTGLSATIPATGASVALAWSGSTAGSGGLAGYRIYRNGALLASTSGTAATYVDSSVARQTTYQYNVAGYDNSGKNSLLSDPVTITTPAPDTVPPSVPANLAATPGFNSSGAQQVSLSWSASSDNPGGTGVAGYNIYRGGTKIGNSSTTTYADTSVIGGFTYSYTASAYDNAGNESAQSAAISVTLPIPPVTGVTATVVSSNQVNISWNPYTCLRLQYAIDSYNIYRGSTLVAQVSAPATSATDANAPPNTSSSYTVVAQCYNDRTANSYPSPTSSAVSVTTPPDTAAPSVPSGLALLSASSSQISLSWNASTDAGGSGLAGYRIYRGATQIGTSSTSSYTDTTVSGSTSYSYTVAAYDGAGNLSAPSSALAVTTPDTIPPSVPSNLAGTPGFTSSGGQIVTLSWSASTDSGGSGLGGYNIYRGGTKVGSSTTTSYTDGVVGGLTFSYTVSAYDKAGNESAQTAAISVSVPVPPVTGVTATAVSSNRVNLSWNAYTCLRLQYAIDSYNVYRGGTLVAQVSAPTTSATDANAPPNTSSSYTVVAECYNDRTANSYLSPTSSAVTVTTPPDTSAPSVPTGLSVTGASSSQVSLSWNASTDTGGSGLAGYRVYRAGSLLGTTSSSSYTDNTVSGNTTYSYTVAAYDNAGNVSSQSSALSVTTPVSIFVTLQNGSYTCTCRAGNKFTISTDAYVYAAPLTTPTRLYQWTNGTPSDYQAMITLKSGVLTNTTGAWVSLGAVQTWSTGSDGSATFTVQIRRASDSVVLATATITLDSNSPSGRNEPAGASSNYVVEHRASPRRRRPPSSGGGVLVALANAEDQGRNR